MGNTAGFTRTAGAASTLATHVAVTGIGLQSALGDGREPTWRNLLAGATGAIWLDPPPQGPFAAPLAGYPLRHAPGRGPIELILAAAAEALEQSGLGELGPEARDRVATVVGLSKGDLTQLGRDHHRQLLEGPGAGPFSWESSCAGGARAIAARWDLTGPCLAPVAACATGLVAVLRAVNLLKRGECDVALAGAADASLDPLVLGAFHRMGVLARVGSRDDPRLAVRPLDSRRAGFLPGEGAAVLVLERLSRARARGAPIVAVIRGGALGGDGHHLTNLDPSPATLTHVLSQALRRARIDPSTVDHVNLHATATRGNDPVECQAVAAALGPFAEQVLASACKPQIGHTLGAAGAIELALTCLAIRDQVVPPTLNRTRPDPACRLRTEPVATPLPIRAALKVSLGFGGHLAALCLSGQDRPDFLT